MTFEIPERAKKEIATRQLGADDAMIEFPHGSGQWAEYTAVERDLIRPLPRAEMEFIHQMKVAFGGRLHSG